MKQFCQKHGSTRSYGDGYFSRDFWRCRI